MEECPTGRGTKGFNPTRQQCTDYSGQDVTRSGRCQPLIASNRDKHIAIRSGNNR
jgi:hypothetical protein